MDLKWSNDVGSRALAVEDQVISERAKSDEDRVSSGLKWSYDDFDHDHTDIHLQIVPEIHKEEEEKSKQDQLVIVPDEHSESGHHRHVKDYSDIAKNRCYIRNKKDRPKRSRIQISSEEESEGFTREVPSVTRKAFKRRRRDEMSDKMRELHQLVPNCYKTDTVSVLDKTIEYIKNLQLQLQMMSIMRLDSYFPTDFGLYNNQTMSSSSPLMPELSWPLPLFTDRLFSHPPAFSLHGLVPYFPSFMDFSSNTMGREDHNI